MKHFFNAFIFVLLWGVGYSLGLESAYVEGFSVKDFISITCFLLGMGWLYYKYAR